MSRFDFMTRHLDVAKLLLCALYIILASNKKIATKDPNFPPIANTGFVPKLPALQNGTIVTYSPLIEMQSVRRTRSWAK